MSKNTQGILIGIVIIAIVGFGLWYSQRDSDKLSTSSNVSYENVDPSGVKINYWYQHTRSREEALTDIINDFNSNNEWGITVSGSHQGHYGQIYEKMLTVVGTAEVPDIVVAYQNQAADFYLAKEGVIDMRPLVNSKKWGLTTDELDDFYPGFISQDIFPSLGGVRLGFPPKRSMELLYYNVDWLKELGFSGPPKTPEEFLEIACAATKNPFSKATTPESSVGWLIDIDASTFASLTFAYGGDVFDKEKVQYTYNSSEAIKAGKLLSELSSKGCMKTFTEKYANQTEYGAGNAMFSISSISGLKYYKSAVEKGANFDWNVGPLGHSTSEPRQNLYGASLSIGNSGDPKKQLAAWLFMKHFTSPDQQSYWAEKSGYFPSRKSVADIMKMSPQYKEGFSLLKYSMSEPAVPAYDVVRGEVEDVMAEIIKGGDVESLLNDLNKKANEILSDI
tara:strand:- start:9800 stop:11146 length:1347 start_codon:yes stop_codon:yes gene_type:complete